MNDAALMRVVHGIADLSHELQQLSQVEILIARVIR